MKQENKRKNKKTAKKRKIKVFSGLFVFFLVFGSGLYLYISRINKPLYISPLPRSVLGSESSDYDKMHSAITNGFKALRLDIDNISQTNDGYIIVLKNKSHIILSKSRDITSQISSLQFILTRLTMEGKLFTQLDLRFDKPVIRFK